ncbi:TPA: hypothetical protein R0F17_003830 [Klebsiella pneumoniae]|uniref:hypothetical protein n=1 Tax=Klebsiella michiganensis TaxID=1134687 RepID=UPI0016663524|nr:hypothetical protein [Klebsiella michiganensis]MBD0985174.1 hypothetical protein [Klebsiella michiganensis]HEB5085585.1 hypothetical protein [Klebsiella pneumoniae]HEB5283206.1 hypothetical protein [Klebsiella pneumoniae]
MVFSLDYDVSDLFVSSESNENVMKVNRLKAREIALKKYNYVKDVEASGGNKHAAELDVQDAVVELLTKIGLSEQKDMVELFNSVLLEETVALTMLDADKKQSEFEEKIKVIEDEAKESATMTAAISWIIAAAVVLVFAGFLFSR